MNSLKTLLHFLKTLILLLLGLAISYSHAVASILLAFTRGIEVTVALLLADAINPLKTLLYFWISLAITYSCAVALILLAFNWWGMRVAIALLLAEVFVNCSYWILLKAQMLTVLPRETWQAISPENCPFLDIDGLHQYSQDLEYLGFVLVKDFHQFPTNAISINEEINPSNFTRIFYHSELCCFAEISQLFPTTNRDPTPIACTIISFMDGGWTLSTTQFKPNPLCYMWRNNKTLWTYYPGAIPVDLLQFHLERRQQIIDDLDICNLFDLSWEHYWDKRWKELTNRQLIFKRKPISMALIEATLFELKPSSEWMGDYLKLAASKRAFIRQ